MAPHGSNLPAAATESAKAARKNFYCELCSKGYARMNEYEAHEGSYDHQHRKRLKEMKHLTHSAQLSSSRNKPESSELQSLSLPKKTASSSSSTGPPKKKAVFKPIGSTQPSVIQDAAPTAQTFMGIKDVSALTSTLDPSNPSTANDKNDGNHAVRNGWWNDRYVPGVISGCGPDCGACGGTGGRIELFQ